MTRTIDTMISRRDLMQGAAAAALMTVMPAWATARASGFDAAPEWMTLLGRSERGGRDYAPEVEGRLPGGLRGSLFRNGPGLFERGDMKIRHLLDGDGLVQRLSFDEQGVRYRNAFVQTPKFVEEEASGRRLHATWSTRRSGNFWDNIGGGVDHSQAGVTVYPVNGHVLARDEVGPTYEVDGQTLDTIGVLPMTPEMEGVGFKAHSKIDPATGEWILAGTKFGPSMTVHAAIHDRSLQVRTQFSFTAPRQVYVHDFLATRRHLIFVLHPCEFSPVRFLAGFRSFIDSLSWNGSAGNIVAVVPRSGGEPVFLEAPGAFMWHALNAFETSDGIVADLVAYDDPDHFIGDDALFRNLMEGRMGRAAVPGTIRRYRIDLKSRRLAEEIVDGGNHEFPMIDGRVAMGEQRVGYFASGGIGAFNSGVKRLDYGTGAVQAFDFGPKVQVGEPVFAEREGGGLDQGAILAQCLDGETGRTFFAVFDAETIGQGPVAKVWLDHHVPISFHGAWQPSA